MRAAGLGALVAVLVLAHPCAAGHSPGDLQWAVKLGGTGINRGHAIATDEAGDVYVTGGFYGTAQFGPGPGSRSATSEGLEDIFIVKMNPEGEVLWAHALGSAYDDSAHAIATDAAGSVYIAGEFRGTVDFDPGPGTAELSAAEVFRSDIFVLKLTAEGEFVWVRAAGSGDGNDYANDLAVDGDGNVLITGGFRETVDFDPGPGVFERSTTDSSLDAFVWKLDANGEFMWVGTMGNDANMNGTGIAVDPQGNVYTAGDFRDTVDFDPGPGTFPLTAENTDVFVSKLNASGEFVWAVKLSGPDFNNAHGIAVDAAGNVHTTGQFRDTVDFDPGAGTYFLNSGESRGVFVSKLDADGAFVWARAMAAGGQQRTLHSEGIAIAVDDDGRVHTTGMFRGTVDFDPGPDTFELTYICDEFCSADVFSQILDADGGFVWAGAMGGPDGTANRGRGIAVNNAGGFYTTGDFYGTVDFDPGPGTIEWTSAGLSPSIFVTKHGEPTASDDEPGDINGDGIINAVDVQLVINAALGIDLNGLDADINGDGAINAVDVQLVINAALGIEISP